MTTPVRSIKNQYRGINAHLHSLWQAEGGWSSFHTSHIGDLNKTLKAKLLPMGYTAEIEPSLQIRRIGEAPSDPESDVTIFDSDPIRAREPAMPISAHSGVLVMPLPKLLGERELSEKPFHAVAIYALDPNRHRKGDPVAWIELLSPSNKGSSRDAESYRDKRLKVLQSGIVYVELDYLHESPPTFPGIPVYRARRGQSVQVASHPYHIVIIDPRPDVDTGEAHISEFDADQPIPSVTIPLNAGDRLDFDFGIPYAKTFEETLYGLELVDYRQLPLNFERYSEADQARIVARLLAVLDAAQHGDNLDAGAPFPVTVLSLPKGLAQLTAWSALAE